MDIVGERTDLPPEVLAAIDTFMHHRRRDSTPLVMSEVVDTIMLAFPGLHTLKQELSEAVAKAAVAGRLSIYFDKPVGRYADTEESRWADDGGS